MSQLPRMLDVSNNQGNVDWRKEKAEGTVAVYCKVSQGMTFTDATAKRRLKNAKYVGLKTGGYHFATPGVGSGESQADRLIALAPLAAGRLRPCLDAEVNPLGLNTAQLAAWYLGFVTRCHSRLGYWPVVYGSPSYLQAFATYHPEVFGLCPLWVANYGVKVPHVPAPWTSWAAWQWTSAFHDPAVGTVDDSYVANLSALLIPKTARTILKAVGA